MLAIAPLAAAWGIGHAEVEDYLGPHQVQFATNYGGEVEINLGPIGNAYLPSPAWPIGVTITVGGVGSATETAGSLFSEQTLAAYTSLYTDPQGAVEGIVERLEQQAVVSGLKVEALLLVAFAAFHLRSRLLAPWVARRLTRRRAVVLYVTVVALVVGSILVPRSQPGLRIPVSVSAQGGPMAVADRGQRAAGRSARPGDQGHHLAQRPAAAGGAGLRRQRVRQSLHPVRRAAPTGGGGDHDHGLQ